MALYIMDSGASPSQFDQVLPDLLKRAWPREAPQTIFSLELVRVDRAHSYPPLNQHWVRALR